MNDPLAIWYSRLRIFAFLGQLFVLTLAGLVFDLSLRYEVIGLIISIIPLTNWLASYFARHGVQRSAMTGWLLVVDTLVLTGVLYESGGPTNPFSLVFFLHIVLASVLLDPRWTAAIAVLTSLCFSLLFVVSRPIPEWHHVGMHGGHGMHDGFSLHLHGMLFAFITVAALTVYFLDRIVGELRKKERSIERRELNAENQQRLARLAMSSAGAAHELGTPLAIIAVVAHELQRRIEQLENPADIIDDFKILKDQAERCKQILEEMRARAGDFSGEMPESITLGHLIEEAILACGASAHTVPIQRAIGDSDQSFIVHRKALIRALAALIQNAIDATIEAKVGIAAKGLTQNEPVTVRIEATKISDVLVISVIDHGIGLSAEAMQRLGELFYSTKPADRGMGLGVYLARLAIEEIGGRLTFYQTADRGTVAEIEISVQKAAFHPHGSLQLATHSLQSASDTEQLERAS